MNKPTLKSALVLLLFCAGNAFGAEASYDLLPDSKEPEFQHSGHIYKLLDKRHQTILDVNLQQNTLSDIKAKFGAPSEVQVTGFHHAIGVCLSSSHANDSTRIVFLKNPMADLHGFVLMSGDNKITTPDNCHPSPAVHKGVKTAGGIMLGDTKTKILKILGSPSSASTSLFKYNFELLTKFPKAQFEQFINENPDSADAAYDTVESRLELEFSHDKLVSYTVTTVKYY